MQGKQLNGRHGIRHWDIKPNDFKHNVTWQMHNRTTLRRRILTGKMLSRMTLCRMTVNWARLGTICKVDLRRTNNIQGNDNHQNYIIQIATRENVTLLNAFLMNVTLQNASLINATLLNASLLNVTFLDVLLTLSLFWMSFWQLRLLTGKIPNPPVAYTINMRKS